MNPYDPNTHPGPHLVAETLGISEVSTLNTTHHHGSPLHQAATRMTGAAHELDERHGQVTDAAKNALRLLEPLGDGKLSGARVSYAILRTSVPKLGDLLTRQDRAYDRLVEAISAYQSLLPEPEHSTVQVHEANQGQKAGRDDDWAIAGDRQLRALEAVETGGLRFHQSGIYGYVYLSDSRGPHPAPKVWPETVQRLVADGLLHQDTRENLYRPGQLLSLTPQGEAALREAHTATARVNATLSDSHVLANPGPDVDSTTVPVAGTSDTASRSHWAAEDDDSLMVLEAVEAGDIRVYRTAVYGHVYFMNDQGKAPNPEICPRAVQRLVDNGLLHQNASPPLVWPGGQLLSLTTTGEAALREARTAAPRVTAALSRSNTPASPGLIADSTTAPVPGASPTASRSR
ncbi:MULTISPECIES: hypothetical protein [unclassified Streptomyces]|uniref:hypothetical protein n=1 Tax=unclassified Streptomyces TaxID=2593676 RepID=UPI0001C1942A|nr:MULTISPECIES: hypothetical protein [unclassified Streptomyces]AEN10808.1 hypothetical protein SACTE_2938 [Streptomyces sp. SirexAA-E]MYR69211.1 hypothetical protein [Streptomyces sp. SID4939]MYS00357.1 hypothetical protein [Streptomyces sp. SID4940]MYT63924.1 hypothetical protein [Streptomyces sp. SID8357]MYT86174.1 hypothetical protein [Streptomyces sp. SID8360]